MEQVSVGSRQGLEHSVVHHPFALFLLLGKVLKEIPPVTMSSFFSCLESCPVSNDQARIRTHSSRACFEDHFLDYFYIVSELKKGLQLLAYMQRIPLLCPVAKVIYWWDTLIARIMSNTTLSSSMLNPQRKILFLHIYFSSTPEPAEFPYLLPNQVAFPGGACAGRVIGTDAPGTREPRGFSLMSVSADSGRVCSGVNA